MASRAITSLARILGARILELRSQRNYSQQQFAAECGLSKGYLSALEAGKQLPSIPALMQIAEALQIDMRDLFLPDGSR